MNDFRKVMVNKLIDYADQVINSQVGSITSKEAGRKFKLIHETIKAFDAIEKSLPVKVELKTCPQCYNKVVDDRFNQPICLECQESNDKINAIINKEGR